MKTKAQTYRDIASLLGNDLGNSGLPLFASFLVIGLSIKPFKDDMPGLVLALVYLGGSLLLAMFLMHFYMAFRGLRILKSIEKDHGPLTREVVYRTFANAKGGDRIEMDIASIAQEHGELRT